MLTIDESPAEWLPDPPVEPEEWRPESEPPVDPEEVPAEIRAAEEQAFELDPEEVLALRLLLQEEEEGQRRAVNRRVDDLDADGVLAAAAETQVSVNLAQARQLFLAAHWADLHAVLDHPERGGRGAERLVRPGGEGTPELAEFAPAELGAVLGLSVVSARLLIADALDLRHRLPRLWHRLQTGSIKIWVARRIASRTRDLSQTAAGRVDDRLCEVAGRIVGGRLEKVLDAAILVADPAKAEADAEQAAARQGVWLSREAERGYGTLVAKAPAPDLAAVDVSLDELARALTILGDEDGHDLRRAKALALLADPEAALETIRRANQTLDAAAAAGPHDGTDPRRKPCDLGRAMLYVHVTDQTLADAVNGTAGGVARVTDVGPVLVKQVGDWLGHRHVTVKPVLDIPGIKAVDRYEFTDPMADALRIVSPAAYFPYSPNTSGHGDNEHPQPYVPPDEGGPPGQTGLHNGAWTPRFPHRIKTHSRWTVQQLRPGAWLWRTPHKYGFLVDEHGTTPLGRLA